MVDLSGIGLSREGEPQIEPHLLANELIERLDFGVVPLEELQVGGLRPGGALGAAHWDGGHLVGHAPEVHAEVLHPQRRALPHRDQLGGLEVRVAETSQVGVLERELLQLLHDLQEFGVDQSQALLHLNDLRVAHHKARSRAEVDDGHRGRTSRPIGVDVRHDVVPELLLLLLGEIVVDDLGVFYHLLDLLLRDFARQAQLPLGLGEGNPEASPRRELDVVAPYSRHHRRGVPLREGIRIDFVIFAHGWVDF